MGRAPQTLREKARYNWLMFAGKYKGYRVWSGYRRSHPRMAKYAFWLVVSSIVSLPFVFVYSSGDSAQWTLSAVTQSIAALLGIIIVGLTLLIQQVMGSEDKLKDLLSEYCRSLSGGKPISLDTWPIEQLRRQYFNFCVENKAHDYDFSGRLLALSAVMYRTCRSCMSDDSVCSELLTRILKSLDILDIRPDRRIVLYYESPKSFFEALQIVFIYGLEMSTDAYKGLFSTIRNRFDHDNIGTLIKRTNLAQHYRGPIFRATIASLGTALIGGALLLSITTAITFKLWLVKGLFTLFLLVASFSFILVLVNINVLMHIYQEGKSFEAWYFRD